MAFRGTSNEKIDDRVALLVRNGTGITFSYNDGNGTLTPTVDITAFSANNVTFAGITFGTTSSFVTTEERIAMLATGSIDIMARGNIINYIDTNNNGSNFWQIIINGFTTVALAVSDFGNVGIGTNSHGTSAVNVFAIKASTAPSTSPADTVQMWEADHSGVAGQGWIHWRSEDGTNGPISVSVAFVNLVTQGAAIAATTLYAVPANAGGVYVIDWVATVTRAATTSSVLGGTNGFQVIYTDGNDSVVKTVPGTIVAGVSSNANNSTATGTMSGSIVVFAKASTNIQYQIDYTSVGLTTMQYNLHIGCRRVS